MKLPRVFDIRRWLGGRPGVLADIDEEFAFHLERCAEELMAGGMSPEEARREARRRFGDRRALRAEGTRILLGGPAGRIRSALPEGVLHDLRTGVRTSLRSPLVTALALLALGLGIGANSAVFSVVEAVLLPDLPYPDAHRLVQIQEEHPGEYDGPVPVTPGNYLAYRERVGALDRIEAYQVDGWSMEGSRHGVTTVAVSDGFLELLGVRPALGRDLAADPDRVLLAPLYYSREVLVTHDFWQEELAGDPEVVGRSLRLAHWSGSAQGLPDGGMMGYTVVGVLPPDFQLPLIERRGRLTRGSVDVVMPLSQGWWKEEVYGTWFFNVVGRLAPEATLEQARGQLEAVADLQREAHVDEQPRLRVRATPLEALPRALYGEAMLLLWGAVGMILAIACVNVACLLLARATAREGEFAVRASLGAGRRRLVRQLFTESSLLAVAGAGLGLGLAWLGTRVGVALFPGSVPGLDEAGLSGPVVAVTVGASLLTVLLFGWGPALLASRSDLLTRLKGVRLAGRPGETRVLRTLVAVEVALAMVLFASAGLLTHSFLRLVRVDPGFDHERVLALTTRMGSSGATAYPTPPDELALEARIVAALKALPGVTSAAAVDRPPLNGSESLWEFTVASRPAPATEERLSGDFRVVGRGYFETMGIPILRGRPFTEEDVWNGPEGPMSVVVGETTARSWWPDRDPVGEVLYWGLQDMEAGVFDERYPPPIPLVVRGVVGDVSTVGLDVDPGPQIYAPTSQRPRRSLAYVVRTQGDPAALAGAARQAILDVDPLELEVPGAFPLVERFGQAVARPRFYAFLLGALAAVSLVLVLAGVYGVLTFLASRRRHEMGVRLAMGARRRDLLARLLRHGMAPVVAGAVVGIGAILASGRLLASHLFAVRPHDPLTLGMVTLLVLALALAASWLPARGASRVDPVESLRAD